METALGAKGLVLKFWMGYAVLVMAAAFIGLFGTSYGAYLLIVFAFGAALFWITRNASHKKSANIALQAVFVLIILECVGAFREDDLFPPLLIAAMLIISAVSLVIWRKGEAPAESSIP